MKKLLAIFFLFSLAYGQNIRPAGHFATVNVSTGASTTTPAYISLPVNYSSTTTTYPVLIFLHGAGEAGTDLSKIYNSTTSGGPPYFIEHNQFPDSVLNPVDGKYYSFIVVAPQMNNSWSESGNNLDSTIGYILKNYRADVNRIYATGLSAGGAGVVEHEAHMDPNEDNPAGGNFIPRSHLLAAAIPMSTATNQPVQLWGTNIAADTVRNWGHGDAAGDVYGGFASDLMGFINTAHAGYATYSDHPGQGHGGWQNQYTPTYSGTAVTGYTGNLYGWLLQWKRNIPTPPAGPTAGAGSDQTINLPTNTTTVTGIGFPGAGRTTASQGWRQLGTQTITIVSPTSATTNITGLLLGNDTLEYHITNDLSVTARDTMVIFVVSSSYSYPVITVGQSTGNITLPTSSFNVTSSVKYNGAVQASFLWSKQKVPGQAVQRIGVGGSSTVAGFGASSNDSAWAGGSILTPPTNDGLMYQYYHGLGLIDSVVNLGVAGTNPYQCMPNGFVPNATVSGQLSPNDTPHVASNITALLKHHPTIVIINFPTNGFDVLSYPNIKIPFQKFADTLTSLGIIWYFTGTQPRSDSAGGFASPTVQAKLKSVNDSLKSWFPGHIIDFYTNTTVSGTTQQIPAYAYGDGVHFNNLGHREIMQQVFAVNPFSSLATSASTITSPTANNTSITGLTTGTHVFIAAAVDAHAQATTGSVSIIVNSGTPTANAGPDRSITLPTSSTTADGTGSTGSASYAWTEISGPNTATIVSPTSSTTSITGLIQGFYRIQLNYGGSLDTMNITVNPQPPAPPCGSGAKYQLIRDPVDSSTYIDNTGNPQNYKPGDTIVLASANSSVDLIEIHGSSGCPITIINPSTSVSLIQNEFTCQNCTYVHITGTGKAGTTYGIFGQHDPQLRYQWRRSISIQGKSSNVEIDHYFAHNVDQGIVAEGEESCDTTGNYPNWVMDSILIHNNQIIGTCNEGMYLGNTSPDNATYDLRPVICGTTTFFYKPAKNGLIHVWDNYVDSTGRGGIQVSNTPNPLSEVDSNTIKHSGLNGDDAQGSGIVFGLYCSPYVHDNTISNTYTWGIASVGGGLTGYPLRLWNNKLDSSGYLLTYNLSTTSRIVYDPRTEPTVPSQILTWPQNVEIDTRPKAYTTDNPPGTGVPGGDSTTFYIKNNTMGIHKNTTSINIENNYGGLQANGNIICSNTNLSGGGSPVITVIPGINYTATCNVVPCQCNIGPRVKKTLVQR